MMRIEPQPMPEHLVDEQGQVRFGVFDRPCRKVDLANARLALGPVAWPAPFVRMRLKQWEHYALISPDLFIGCAMVDVKYLRTSWCSVLDRRTGRRFEHKRMGPACRTAIADNVWRADSSFAGRGYRLTVEHRLDEGYHRLAFDIAARRNKPAVTGRLHVAHDAAQVQSMVVVLPVGPNQGMYTHKVALPVSGTVRVGERSLAVEAANSVILFDIHHALYPYRTFWNWATGAGYDRGGRLLAFNLTRNVNLDDDHFNENGVWIDGRLQHVGPVRFTFDRKHRDRPWQLRTTCDRVDLEFTPLGARQENLQLGAISSRFHQPYGTFRGTVRYGSETVAIEDLFGLCEDHECRW